MKRTPEEELSFTTSRGGRKSLPNVIGATTPPRCVRSLLSRRKRSPVPAYSTLLCFDDPIVNLIAQICLYLMELTVTLAIWDNKMAP